MADDPFQIIVDGNAAHVARRTPLPETAVVAKGLAVVTCIDTRIDPLEALGLEVGDAKIIRNAGARVTDDAVRSLAVACAVLGVQAIAVVAHTRCAMASTSEDQALAAVSQATGRELEGVDFATSGPDQLDTLRADVERLRTSPLIPDQVDVGGFVLDLDTGELHREV